MNGGVESRVRLPNIEFSYVRQLQQDNSELRSLVEEHQAALQMIMTKYRQQASYYYYHLILRCVYCTGARRQSFWLKIPANRLTADDFQG